MKLVNVLQTCTVLYEALQEALLVLFYSRIPCLRNNITTFTELINASFKTCAYYCFRSVYIISFPANITTHLQYYIFSRNYLSLVCTPVVYYDILDITYLFSFFRFRNGWEIL